jgi:DNA-binding CsgD family transcriptional regulator
VKHRPLLPYIGFSLFLLVDILSFYSGTVFSDGVWFEGSIKSLYFLVLTAARVVVFLFIALTTLFVIHITAKRRQFLILLCSFLAVVAIAILVIAVANNSTIQLVIGAVLLGVSQGTLGLFWLSSLVAFDYRGSYLYIIVSHAFATILCAFLLFVASTYLLPCMIVCLLLSGLSLYFLPEKNPKHRNTSDTGDNGTVHGNNLNNIQDISDHNSLIRGTRSQIAFIASQLKSGFFAVSMFALLSGFMSSISAEIPIYVDPVVAQYMVFGISGFVLIVMIIPALVFRKPLEIETSYKIALPLSALSFLILPGFTDLIPPFIAGTLATAGYMLTSIVLYCSLAELAKITRSSALTLFALVESMSLAISLVGTFLGRLLVLYVPVFDFSFALIGMGCLYLFILCASWLFTRDRTQNSRVSQELDRPISLQKVAEDLGLSDQEYTILSQLVEGRTLPRIASELYISTSTVKYHVQKIYRTLNVHSRNELIGTIFELQQSAATDVGSPGAVSHVDAKQSEK